MCYFLIQQLQILLEEKEVAAALFCANPSAQPEIREVSGTLDSRGPKYRACQDQGFASSSPLCSSYCDLSHCTFSQVAMGSNWKYFVWRCSGLFKVCGCVKGKSSVVKWLGLLIWLTVQNTTQISGAVAAKSRSINGNHIWLKTISTLESLLVCMSAVFCPSPSFCIPSWQLARQHIIAYINLVTGQ